MQVFQQALLDDAGVAPEKDFTIQRALEAVRRHLGMEVAYLSEFVGDDSVFHYVDAPGLEALIKPGDKRSLDEVYCRHILAGRLPELIPDTSTEPLAVAMPITQAVPIGSHASIPIRLAAGRESPRPGRTSGFPSCCGTRPGTARTRPRS